MKIDITEIAGRDSTKMEISVSINTMDFEHKILGIKLYDNIEFKSTLSYMKGYIYLEGNIKGKYITSCNRCLRDIDDEYNLTMKEKYSLEMDDNDDESYIYEGHFIEIEHLIIDNISFSVPTIILCKDSCKGLCQVCGIDRNIDKCTCDTQGINIKMEKLKDYFKK